MVLNSKYTSVCLTEGFKSLYVKSYKYEDQRGVGDTPPQSQNNKLLFLKGKAFTWSKYDKI